MKGNRDGDITLSDEEREECLRDWGTTDFLAVQRALHGGNVRFVANLLRQAWPPGKEVIVALANMLDPPQPAPREQQWRLELKRLGRGAPKRALTPKDVKIVVALRDQLEKQKRNGKRISKKRAQWEVARQYGIDEKTVRNIGRRLTYRPPGK